MLDSDEAIKKGFAERLTAACDANPNVPPLHHGRLTWVVEQFKKRFGEERTPESVRRWMGGMAIPRQRNAEQLAEIIGTDVGWLLLGEAQKKSKAIRSLQESEAEGIVSVVAGLVRSAGGSVALPREGDNTNGSVDLYAIIKGAQYSMSIAKGNLVAEGRAEFSIAMTAQNSFVLGFVQLSEFAFRFFEIDFNTASEKGTPAQGKIVFDTSIEGEVEGLKEIKTFRDRL